MQIIQTRSDPRDLCVSFQERHQALAEPQLSRHAARSRADLFRGRLVLGAGPVTVSRLTVSRHGPLTQSLSSLGAEEFAIFASDDFQPSQAGPPWPLALRADEMLDTKAAAERGS